MKARRWTAAFFAAWVMVPVLAVGRPGCCMTKPSPVGHGCCASTTSSLPKGCCKAPAAPKLDDRTKDDATLATNYSVFALAAPVVLASPTDAASALRIARRLHVADSPDDSPPDLLSRNAVLLI